MRRSIGIILILLTALGSSACAPETPVSTPAPAVRFTPTPQALEPTAPSTVAADPAETFSSEQLGLCFSYPRGYTQVLTSGTVEIAAPDLPGSDVKGLFWLETSDAYDRTAEVIASQDLTFAEGLNVGTWTEDLAGETAVVLDGMPGQELQRRVYAVHQGDLYVLAFWPALSENQEAAAQMEALYNAVIHTWTWSPCTANQ